MYPTFLNPAYAEIFQLSESEIEIPKCVVQFQKWKGIPLKESFGGKVIVSVDDKPMFAELALLKQLIDDGWQARWLLNYNRRNKPPVLIAEWKDEKYENQKHEPIAELKINALLNGIAKLNSHSYEGCWDVLAWKNGEILFAQAKRNNKDLLSETKTKWLAAALDFGLQPDNFLVMQWDYNPRCA
ncbi:MAG: hypothetical protein NTY88_13935 [Bacteroidetes bacterium]|nr:hypothetical protein [Bacteroidota bacterium]